MQPIFLVGYMGCGKSTLGRTVSAITGCRFIDLDTYIEGRYHHTVKELFALHGESGFRDLERNMLHEVGQFEDVVVACGGGTPCFNNNMEYMLSRSDVVWLDATVDRIVERLVINSSRRPLIKGKYPEEIRQTVEKGLSDRIGFYSKANIRFSGEHLEDKRQITTAIDRFLDLYHDIK